MEKSTNKLLSVAMAIALAMLIIFSLLAGGGVIVYASASEYTNVLTDLKTDESFKAEDYPENVNDTSINLIQIGEGENGELFIYTYQPSGQILDLKATSISLSRVLNDSWRDYDLIFHNSNGVFFKYSVKYFVVSTDPERYYDINVIWEATGRKPGSGQVTTANKHTVAQRWRAITAEDGAVSYAMEETEVALVNDFKIHFRRYPNGLSWGTLSRCDAHFVAFNSDRQIDELKEADVTFSTQNYHGSVTGGEVIEEPVKQPLRTVKGEVKSSNKPFGSFGQKYEWKQIQTVPEFLSESESLLTDEEKAELKKYKWVLNFYETEYTCDNVLTPLGAIILGGPVGIIAGLAGVLGSSYSGTFVTDVSILRLNYIYAGRVYNVGVVMDKAAGSRDPAGTGLGLNIPWWVWLIVAVVAVIVLICIVQVLKVFFPVFGLVLSGICAGFKAIGRVIAAPFKAIGRAIKNRKARSSSFGAGSTGKRKPAGKKRATSSKKGKGGKK